MSLRWGKLPFLGSEDEFFYHKRCALVNGAPEECYPLADF